MARGAGDGRRTATGSPRPAMETPRERSDGQLVARGAPGHLVQPTADELVAHFGALLAGEVPASV